MVSSEADNAPNDIPTPVVIESFNEWTLNSGMLYWAERCFGGEISFPGYLRRLPVNGGTKRTLADVDKDHCVTFLNMVADSSGVYYYSAVDSRLEAHLSGKPTVTTPIFSLTQAQAPVGDRLAVDGNFIYWLTGSELVRVRKNGSQFGIIATGVSGGTDVVASNGVIYWLDNGGLWVTNVLCGSLPCPKRNLSPHAGAHLLLYFQSRPVALAGPRLVWAVGPVFHRVNCSDITAFCSEEPALYTAPNDGNPWELGRPATDGTNLFWQEGYFNALGTPTGRLRRMPLGGGTVDEIAANLYMVPAPVYIDTNFIFFASVDNSINDILKLPLNASALVRDLTADALEVTQGIQNLSNDTPVVAHKTTFVRAFSLENSGPNALAVDAVLFGTRAGAPLPGSPLHPINGKIATAAGVTYNRGVRDSGWLFQLPDSWLDTGTVILRLVVDPGQAYNDPNRLNNELSRTIVFQTREQVCNVFIPVHTDAPLPSTDIANFWQMIDYARRLWPTSEYLSYKQDSPVEELEVCTWHHIPYPCFGPYELPDDTWKVFTSLKVRSLLTDDPDECDSPSGNTHYVGMVDPSTDTGTTTGTGMTVLFNLAWVKFSNDIAADDDPFAPRSGETLAHELGHNLGRQHVDCGGPDDPDTSYPYPTDQIDNVGNSNHFGFDVKSLKVISPNGAKDFMGYCTPKWTSDYTWKALFAQLAPGNGPQPASVSTAPELASAANVVMITGAITPTANTGSLDYALNFPSAALSAQTLQKWQQSSAPAADQTRAAPQAGSVYHVRLLNAANQVLADQMVTPVKPDIHEAPSPVDVFLATFPAPAGTVARIELLQDNQVLADHTSGPAVPTVSLSTPAGGEVIKDLLELIWQGHDTNPNDVLHYSVQYSPDNGQTWISLVTDVAGLPDGSQIHLSLHPSGIPGSLPNQARIRVAASDGYNTGFAISPAFTVSNRKPEPFILSPSPGENAPAGQDIPLRGVASDAEDGAISGAALSWTVDGQPAGTGEQASAAGLAPGDHALVLTARDSFSQTATTQATLSVLPLSIPSGSAPSLDGYCDDAGYAGASQVLLKPYASGDQASARLMQDGSAVWVCFSGLQPGAETPGAFAGVRLDANHSRDNLAQTDDYAFFVGEDGSILSFSGDGAGGFENQGPEGVNARVSAAGSTWSAELRIDAFVLGGLDHVVGLNLGHYSVSAQDDDYVWPYNSVTNQPKSWATTALAALPAIDQLSPSGATLGDPDFTLVITGENFVDGSQVLWSGIPLSTTFGTSSLISATINASLLNTAGQLPITVLNPGDIASGTALFTVRNPQPLISGLTPGLVQAGRPAFTLHVIGSHFVSGAKVLWNGQALPTTFVNSGQLDAQVSAALIQVGQVASLTVLNPEPSVGVSPAAPFGVSADFQLAIPLVLK